MEGTESERNPKCLLNRELFGVRRRGTPERRWLQDVKDDLSGMKKVNGKRKHRNEIHGGVSTQFIITNTEPLN
jgi:hypothetical protein